MYLINKNEIRISKFLKGGAFVSLAKSNSFDTHPIEGEIYKSDRIDNFGYLLNFDDKFDYNRVRPLFSQEIDFENFDQNMFVTIILTLNLFLKYIDFLQKDDDLNDQTFLHGPNTNVNKEEAKKIRKKLVILGISVLKALGLYNHNENIFVEFDDFEKKVFGNYSKGNVIARNNYPNLFKNNASKLDIARTFKEDFIRNPNAARLDGLIILLNNGDYSDVNNFIKNTIEKDIFLYNGIESFTEGVNVSFYFLKSFYEIIKELKPLVLTDEECLKIYFRQKLVDPPSYNMINPRFLGGGNYDQLEYMLNGGSLNTIVRIPNLSNYFKSQLRFVEQKLKIHNKNLSEKSRKDIEQIIDALERHETNLKKQFELLKNAHLIDEDEIKIDLHSDKLKKAKNSLNKHIRYSGFLGDILRTIAQNIKKEMKDPVAAFERLQ